MSNDEGSLSLKISQFLTKFMKQRLGRGPKNVEIKITENTLIFFVTGILSPMEQIILQSPNGEEAVYQSRLIYVNESNKQRIPNLESIVGLKAIDHYETWNFKKDIGVGVVVFEDNIQ